MFSTRSMTGVGMRDGSCLLFDQKNVLILRIENAQFGAVTAIGLSQDGKRVLLGFSRGKARVLEIRHRNCTVK